MALPRPSAGGDPARAAEEQQAREAFERTLAAETASGGATAASPKMEGRVTPSGASADSSFFPDDRAAHAEMLARQQRGASPWAKVGAGLAGLLLLGGVGAGVWFLGPGNSDQPERTGGTTVGKREGGEDNSTGKTNAPVKSAANQDFWKDQAGVVWPITLNEWEKVPATVNPNKNSLPDKINQKYATSELYQTAQTLPSKTSGFTSDPRASTNSDGTINPRFSFLLAEDASYLIASDLEFFTNPAFGDWVGMQYAKNHPAKNFQKTLIADKYAPSAFEKYGKAPLKAWVPVYADWDGNDYGMKGKLLDTGPRWMGKVMKTKTDLKYDKATLQYTAHVTANVLYTAWLQDGSTTTKNGVITLDYVTNTDNPENTARKMLISSSSLKLAS